MSFKACVTPVAPVGKTGNPVKVGEAKFAFKSKADCWKVLTGLFASLVLSIFPIPKLVLALMEVVAPVPPFTTATTPDTLVAFPVTVPVKLPVTSPTTLPVCVPLVFALILPAEKLPLASRFTMVLAKLVLVAVPKAFTENAILSFVFPPTLNTKGVVAVPPKSPANNIFPLEMVVASATEFVIFPEASAKAFATYAVVANFTELSLRACVTPVVPVGKTGNPVKVGETKFAFKSNAACCNVLTGLFKSVVLFTFPNPKLDNAAVALLAPVPPFSSATTPDTLVAFPVTLPIKLPVTTPVTLPVTLPVRLPMNLVEAVIVLPEKSPIALLLTI